MRIDEKAEGIARISHFKQFRWDGTTPYITHPQSVAEAVEGEAAKAVAWLHDVLEDTTTTVQDLKDAGIPYEIVQVVLLLTKIDGENYLNYLLRVKESPIARTVKLADIRHNMSTLDKKKNKNSYEKYLLAEYILSDLEARRPEKEAGA